MKISSCECWSWIFGRYHYIQFKQISVQYAGFSFSAHPLASMSVKTDGGVEFLSQENEPNIHCHRLICLTKYNSMLALA